MNFLFVSIIAYILNSLATLGSKFILTKNSEHPISYVFYISASSLIVLPFIFFVKIPGQSALVLLSLSTLLWTIGAYFMFSALSVGVASRVAPIIGTLNPIFLIIYYFFFTHSISLNQVWGAMLCTVGLGVIIFPYLHSHLEQAEQRKNRFHEIIFELLSGLFFAVSYILLKEGYNQTSFFSGLLWSRLILIPILGLILFLPVLRKLVFSSKGDKIDFKSKVGVIFITSQAAGGASQFLITLAVSLANPAIVNSMQGVQYILLFVVSLFLTKRFPHIFNEDFSTRVIVQRVFGIIIIAGGLFILAFANNGPAKAIIGITYSPRYAESLGLNPKETYIRMLDELNPQTLRLPVYWDLIEPQKNNYDFTDLDYYVNQAEKKGTKLTLVVGMKVPRYPECYTPDWATSMSADEQQTALFEEMTRVVNRYKNVPTLTVWQVENEPLFPFGTCPKADIKKLGDEIGLVRQLDPAHPVMVTESGEFGLWLTTSGLSDIVGTTLYRRTLAPYFPQFRSPVPPFYYQFKGMVVHLFYPNKPIYVSELQGEPWANQPIQTTSYEYQKEAFPVSDLKDNVEFSKEAGFDTIYLWGVEWWYYLAAQGHPEYLNQAKMIYNDIN